MALADVCGFKTDYLNFTSPADIINPQIEISNLTGNFENNIALALPPAITVIPLCFFSNLNFNYNFRIFVFVLIV